MTLFLQALHIGGAYYSIKSILHGCTVISSRLVDQLLSNREHREHSKLVSAMKLS